MLRNTIAALVLTMVTIALGGCDGRSSLLPGHTAEAPSVQRGTSTVAEMPFLRQRVSAETAIASLHPLCGAPARGSEQCYAIATRYPLAPASEGVAPDGNTCYPSGNRSPICYIPSSLQAAYHLAGYEKNGGKGQTVAVVDAYGYPTATSDLRGYRKAMKLPALCKTCLTIYNQNGNKKPLPAANPSWEGETALDLDMITAVCPNCKIVLIEARDSETIDMTAAVRTALTKADVVSLSWGGSEIEASDPIFDKHPGKVIVAAAGDGGAAPQEPCSFSGVVCVGGTTLTADKSKRGWNEVVWDDLTKDFCSDGPCATGSGCSFVVAKPSWQTDKGCARRSEADISAVADPHTGVLIYAEGMCCYLSGGTSASAPLIAGMYGLAGNARTQKPATLWSHAAKSPGDFNDVVKGRNDNAAAGTFMCPKTYAYICKAGAGYDGPSGWGTPNGLGAL